MREKVCGLEKRPRRGDRPRKNDDFLAWKHAGSFYERIFDFPFFGTLILQFCINFTQKWENKGSQEGKTHKLVPEIFLRAFPSQKIVIFSRAIAPARPLKKLDTVCAYFSFFYYAKIAK